MKIVEDCISVGKVKGSHGIKGDLLILIYSKEFSWLNKINYVYLKSHSVFSDNFLSNKHSENINLNIQKNQKQQILDVLNIKNIFIHKNICKLSIKKIRPNKKSNLIITSYELSNKNQSDFFISWDFLLPTSIFCSKPGENIYLKEIEGFLLKDKNNVEIGRIIKFSGSKLHDTIIVLNEEKKELEIPLIKDIIINIDYENKIIKMDLPVFF